MERGREQPVKLVHLSAVGTNVPAATLEFAPHLTVIYGASEAGKSYIGEAIDYMLGAGKLRSVPESAGYQQMLLALDLDGDVVTLARSLRGGKISVFDGDIRDVPDGVPDQLLAASHSKGKTDTISHFLLDRLGVADAKLRKNKRNETVALSFRHIAHLVVIGEERMHSRTSPVESGNYNTRTTELSAFKLLLEADDDAGLDAGEDPTAFRRLNRAQVAVLERAITQATSQVEDAPDRPECMELLGRVDAGIRARSESMSAEIAARDHLIAERDSLTDRRRLNESRSAEATALEARFSSLAAQYRTDLQRLDMVKSAGTLLGYFDADACVFCGAAAAHQNPEHAVYETARLTEAIDAESARTRALCEDLEITLTEIRDVASSADISFLNDGRQISKITDAIEEADQRLRPTQVELSALMSRRSELERWITVWEQVDELQALSNTVAQQQPDSADPVGHGIGKRSEQEFSAKLRGVLSAWKVPAAERAEFVVENTPDVILEGRPRADRGKGIRSVLHAGFSAALGEYCLEGDLPHPGFLVLDTPVLTYRDADSVHAEQQGVDAGSVSKDELVAPTVAQAFYDYLAEGPLQTVVLENQTPPIVTAPGCEIVYFSGTPGTGRSGFYPSPEA